MGRTTIEWSTHSWNPGIYGCSVASPACDHCYAAKMAHRLVAMGVYPEGITKPTKVGPHWSGRVIVADGVNTNGLPKKGPARVFTTSMADLFHADVPVAFIREVFAVMEERPTVTFLVLTKRAQRMAEVAALIGWPENAWALATVEDQARADERIPWLLKVPAVVRGVSMEPLLGPVDLAPWLDWGRATDPTEPLRSLHWVFAGGESGSRARPTHPMWARLLRDQCAAARVPFLWKQWGTWVPDTDKPCRTDLRIAQWVAKDGRTGDRQPVPDGAVWGARLGKARAGRLLDGVQHDGFPEVRP